MSLDIRQDRRYIRSRHRSDRYLLVELTAPTSTRQPTRDQLTAAFVLDRSGSMAGQKIALARSAIDAAVGSLATGDRFAIVAYDDRVDVVWPEGPVSGASRSAASRALATVEARGSTNLFEGWMRGCAEVAAHQDGSPGMHRVLLMSDGLANQGVTDREELVRHAGELWRRGVATWTFGFGTDFDEDLLDRLAVAGGGQAYYVAHPAQIADHITSAIGEALDVVARDAVLQAEVPEGVLVEPLGLYRSHRRGPTLAVVELGDLVSEQQLRVVLRVNLPTGRVGEPLVLRLTLADRDGVLAGGPLEVRFEYADDRVNDTQARDREVDREVAGRYAARARTEAAQLNRTGDFRAADQVLRGVARRIRGYAGDDPVLRDLMQGLEQEQARVAAPMLAGDRLELHFRASYALRDRDVEGRARRGPAPDGGRP